MNLLRNPWMTGALVFVALLLVLVRTPGIFNRATAGAAATFASVVQETLATPAPIKSATNVSTAIEKTQVESLLAQWINAPHRDPFHAATVATRQISEPSASPLAKWKLKGVWTQTGGRTAAINDGVYGEGDRIGDYQLERIDEAQVWLRGPDGLEHLGFTNTPPEAATNHNRISAQSARHTPTE